MEQKYIQDKYQMFIGGKWVDSITKKTIDVFNPSNGQYMTTIPDASAEDINNAVIAANKAFDSWKRINTTERAAILNKIADIIDENLEELAMVETLDNGKAIRECRSMDIPLASDHFRYFAGVIRADETSATMLDDDTMSITLREPLGVVGQIVPWNFPFLMAAWKIAPALAAGNCVVFKPSSETSLSVLTLVKMIESVLPPGVLNIVTGKGSGAGQSLLDHQGIRKLAFTGSTDIGYDVAKAAAEKIIPATLELGGKSANIIFPDAPIDKALEGVQLGILWNSGQVCCAGSRIFVHEAIYDEFIAQLVTAFENIKVGLPWQEETIMGAMVNKAQLEKVLNYIEIGKSEGAKVACGGIRVTEKGLDKGYFLRPTLLVNVDNKMRVAQEEIFGPVGVVIKFKDAEDVIAKANDSEYGLGGAVWTKDINTAFKVAREVETGRMWINTYGATPAHCPFGGYKKSGLGRETHKSILDHYTQSKNIYLHFTEIKAGLY